MRVAILAAGDFPTRPEPMASLHEADFVVCCDSAYATLHTINYPLPTNFIVIGDGDSLPVSDKDALGDRYLQVDEQDYNDLHKAMLWATTHYPLSTTHFTIVGATGKREDHTLGNIAYLVTFAEEYPGIELEMLTDYGRLCALRGRRRFDSFPRQQVSIFAMDADAAVTSQGLRWQLTDFRPARWWQATLNEATGNEFTLDTDGWMVVFQTYDPKV